MRFQLELRYTASLAKAAHSVVWWNRFRLRTERHFYPIDQLRLPEIHEFVMNDVEFSIFEMLKILFPPMLRGKKINFDFSFQITWSGLNSKLRSPSSFGQICCNAIMASLQNFRPITSSSSRPYLGNGK